jgi:anti-sigma factor RsiW
MNSPGHDQTLLGAYVLGALDPYETRSVEAHLAGCAECRWELNELGAIRNALNEVPPEAFLDGTPTGGDMLLQRTLRAARDAGNPPRQQTNFSLPRRRRTRVPMAAAVIVLAAAALGGGVLIGRETAPTEVAAAPTPSVVSPVPGERSGQATDQKTGVTMQVKVIPAAGWVRVHAEVAGVQAGEKCLLRVVPKSGTPMTASSWLASDKAEANGVVLDGSALVDPSQVDSVDVVTTDGRKVVAVKV